MSLVIKTIKIDGDHPGSGEYYIPCMTNCTELQRGDVLLYESEKGAYPSMDGMKPAKRARHE